MFTRVRVFFLLLHGRNAVGERWLGLALVLAYCCAKSFFVSLPCGKLAVSPTSGWLVRFRSPSATPPSPIRLTMDLHSIQLRLEIFREAWVGIFIMNPATHWAFPNVRLILRYRYFSRTPGPLIYKYYPRASHKTCVYRVFRGIWV